MPFFFRLIGLVIGLRFAKAIALYFSLQLDPHQATLIGGAAGFVLGLALDAGVHAQMQKFRFKRYIKRRLAYESNELFFTSVFSMLAKLAQADGGVSEQELACVERVSTELLKLKRKQKKIARQIFNSAGRSASPFQIHAAQFCQLFGNQPAMLEGMLNILFQLAVADKALSVAEERLIISAAQIFGLDKAAYQAIASRYVAPEQPAEGDRGYAQRDARGDAGRGAHREADKEGRASAGAVLTRVQQAYAVLGCKETDSPQEIKSRYRKLINDFHPDKIVSKELPAEFTAFATQKFREIQEAYETLKRERRLP